MIIVNAFAYMGKTNSFSCVTIQMPVCVIVIAIAVPYSYCKTIVATTIKSSAIVVFMPFDNVPIGKFNRTTICHGKC